MKIISALILTITALSVFAQQGNNWYFGQNAGINFSSGSAVAITDGLLNTEEGCASISDENGNLMFYTDGVTVWDRTHNVMTNGSGLYGNISATQSALAVQKPDNPDIYFLFTVGAGPYATTGHVGDFCYNVIDFSSDPNGEITSKNQVLVSGNITEKLTAVLHGNGDEVWVIMHEWGSNTFRAYEIDATTANGAWSFVSSSVGPAHDGDTRNSIGYMKASPDGNSIATAIMYDSNYDLFDFDKCSGEITYNRSFINYEFAYGMEFSPNGDKLYMASNPYNSSLGYRIGTIYQHNISAHTTQTISTSSSSVAEFQVAPDGNIYVAKCEIDLVGNLVSNSDYLGLIENPNSNTPTYTDNGFLLDVNSTNANQSTAGLPSFIQSFFEEKNHIIIADTCLGNNTSFTLHNTNGLVNSDASWDFGDGSATETGLSKTHTYASAGTYTVTCNVKCFPEYTYEVHILALPAISLSSNSAICSGEDLQLFENGGEATSWSWTGPNGFTSTNEDPTITSATTLASGDYNVTVNNATCENTATLTNVLVRALPNVTANNNDADNQICLGETINLTAGGATTYTWESSIDGNIGSGASLNYTPTSAISYTVTVTGNDGNCNNISTTSFTVNPLPNIYDLTGNNSYCSGTNPTNVDIMLSGSDNGIDYQLYNGATTVGSAVAGTGSALTWTDVENGTYTVVANNTTTSCESNMNNTVTITVDPLPTANAGTDQNISSGDDVQLNGTAGNGTNYSYNWSPATYLNFTNIEDPLAENVFNTTTYTLIVTDGVTHCESNPSQVTLTVTGGALACNPSANPSTICAGASVQLNANSQGGTGTHHYSWTSMPVGFTSNIANPTVNPTVTTQYTVEVTDDATTVSNSVTVTVNPLPSVTANSNDADNTICLNDEITLYGSGTSGVTYAWDNSVTDNVPYTPTANNTYTVTATITATGCTNTDQITININPLPTISITPSPNDTICFNQSFSFTATGGNTYHWENNVNTDNADVNPYNYTPPTAGDYTFYVTVTDENSCSNNSFIETRVNFLPTINTFNITDVACFGDTTGSIQVNVNELALPYTYEWNTLPTQNTNIATDLIADDYTVIITDGNNCENTFNYTVNQPASALTAVESSINSTCSQNDGTAIVTPSGGTTGYTYSWNNYPDSTNNSISNIVANVYQVTVTDANQCNVIIDVTVSDAGAGTINILDIEHNACFGDTLGLISTEMIGGSAPFNYNWSGNLNANNYENDSSLINLGAGIYTLNVSDANNCNANLNIEIKDSTLIIPSFELHKVLCNGDNTGWAVANATGGAGNYSYTWSTSLVNDTIENLYANQNYYVTTSDVNNCEVYDTISVSEPLLLEISIINTDSTLCYGDNNGSAVALATGGVGNYSYQWNDNAQTQNASVFNLQAGSYNVIVTDTNLCTANVDVVIYQPDSLNITINTIDANCGLADGSATATVIGGTTEYNYYWSNNETTNTASNLQFGSYSLTVVDANQCTDSVNLQINNIDAGTINFDTIINLSCYNNNTGKVVASFTNGTPNYTFMWSNNTTTVGQSVDTISNLNAGEYSLTVVDANNCISIDTVLVTQPDSLYVTDVEITNINCYNKETGQIIVTAIGGTREYNYVWDNTISIDSIANNLKAGQYILQITDANNCKTSNTFTLTQNEQIQISLDVTNTNCPESNNGAITSTVTGGVSPYKYIWNNLETTYSSISELDTGIYKLEVVDILGCTTTTDTSINYIEETCLLIPTVITPNADGFNDTWEIKGIDFYENVQINIFNRWGDEVFSFTGTGEEYSQTSMQWDGTYKGMKLPLGTYVYILNIEAIDEVYKGTVTIVR